jgi:hypothetical protein
MTTVEINNKIAVLESESSALSMERNQLEKTVDANVKEVLRTYLKAYNVFTDGFTIGERSSGTYWHISRTREENGYEREELTIYLKESYDRFKPDFINALRPSFYTTSEISRYELERMSMIGKIGTMLLEKEKTILETINQVRDEHKEQISNLGSSIWKIDRELSELRRQLTEIGRVVLLNKALNEGVEFVKGDCLGSGTYKNVRVGKYLVCDVRKIKATLIGRGGYCDLESTHADGTQHTFNRVKTQALKDALVYNRERIIS